MRFLSPLHLMPRIAPALPRTPALLAAGLLTLLMTGCANIHIPGVTAPVVTRQPQVVTPPPPPPPPPVADPVATDTWTGAYRTVLPCPDCQGVAITLTLFKDATYELRTEALGVSAPTARSGTFTFNADETRITLDSAGQGRMFDIISPTALRMLDRHGQPVTNMDADKFILRK